MHTNQILFIGKFHFTFLIFLVKHSVFMKKQPFLDFLCEVMLHSPCGKRTYTNQSRRQKAEIEDVLSFLDIHQPTYKQEVDFLLKHCKRKYITTLS